MLKKDFNIKNPTDRIKKQIDDGEDIVSVVLTSKDTPGQTDTINRANNDVLAISRLNKTISVFITAHENQINEIRHYNYKKNIH